MRILMVSPYPPLRDGVGRYAEQEVLQLQADGNEVEVISPTPSAAHHYTDLRGGLRLAKLLFWARRFDKVILQYQPSHYHKRRRGFSRIFTNLGMLIVFLGIRNLEIVCHEVEYPGGKIHWWFPDILIERLAWRWGRGTVVLHSERELTEMRERLGTVPRRHVIRRHEQAFRRYSSDSKEEARERLGIPQGLTVLLCIGFLHPHKGFDRAIRAFSELKADSSRLFIVGGVRITDTAKHDYLGTLRHLATQTAGVELRAGLLTDEEFDRWIIAADLIVLPYRSIWSSSVMGRAQLLERPVIATNVGALPEQAGPNDVIVDSDEGLRDALGRWLGVERVPSRTQGSELTYEEAASLIERKGREMRMAILPAEGAADLETLRKSIIGTIESPLPMVYSSRRVLGPVVNIVRKTLRRLASWYVGPVIDQLSKNQLALLEAIESSNGKTDLNVQRTADGAGKASP